MNFSDAFLVWIATSTLAFLAGLYLGYGIKNAPPRDDE